MRPYRLLRATRQTLTLLLVVFGSLRPETVLGDFLNVTDLPWFIPSRQPTGIAVGADGATWFTLYASGQIGRYSGGSFSFWDLPVATSQPLAITAGPDSRFWFTEYGSGKIGRIAANGTIDEFPLSSGAHPYFITAGPDGNLWFTDFGRKSICRTTTSGSVSEFPVGGSPAGIAVGPDGNLWYTLFDTGAVGSMTTSGSKTEYTLPSAASGPHGITPGPDGNVWFTELTGNRIGRITLTGALTEFDVPRASAQPWAIAAASDGLLYFSEYAGHAIGRMKTDGTMSELKIRWCMRSPLSPAGIARRADGELVFALSQSDQIVATDHSSFTIEFALPAPYQQVLRVVQGPDSNGWFVTRFPNAVGRITPFGAVTFFTVSPSIGYPEDICSGPDGNIWYTDPSSDRISRISPSGVITDFPVTPMSWPGRISAGPDGNLWFTQYSQNRLGRMTTAGVVTDFTLPSLYGAYSITPGPDGNVWYTIPAAGTVGRMTPSGVAVEFHAPSGYAQEAAGGPGGSVWFLGYLGVGSVSPTGIFETLPDTTIFKCIPTGLAAGVSDDLWIGCSRGSVVRFLPATGFSSEIGLSSAVSCYGPALNSVSATDAATAWATAPYEYSVIRLTIPARGFYVVPPCRLLDTRILAPPTYGNPLGPGWSSTFFFTGLCGIPVGTEVLSLNVTVTSTASSGYFSLLPSNLAPSTSLLNFSQGQTRANNAIIRLSRDPPGSVQALNGSLGMLHLIVDVNGYFR